MTHVLAYLLAAAGVTILAAVAYRAIHHPGQRARPRGERPAFDERLADTGERGYGHHTYAWSPQPVALPSTPIPPARPQTMTGPPHAAPDMPGAYADGCPTCGDPGHEWAGHDMVVSILSPPSFRAAVPPGELAPWVVEALNGHQGADASLQSIVARRVNP